MNLTVNRCQVTWSVSAVTALALSAAPALAQPAPPPGQRLFGVEEAPPSAALPSGPRIVMRLSYTPVDGCPNDQAVRTAIGAQVRHWDPFAPNAPRRLAVAFSRAGAGFVGSAELIGATGMVEWKRALAPRARCFDLVEDLAVKLALHINPPALPVPAAQPPPQPLSTTSEERAHVEVPTEGPPSRAAFRIGLGTWMDLATAPRPAFGLTADVGFRFAWFSLAGELRWDPPAGGAAMDGADVSTALITGALVPCGHASWFFGCLVGELGQFRGSLAVTGVTPDHRATLYGRAGARLGVEIPVVRDRLFVRLSANLLGAPVRPRLRLTYSGQMPQVEWESPAFTGGLGAGLGASF